MSETERRVTSEGQGEAEEGSSSSSAKCCVECGLTFGTLAKYKYHRLRLHGAWRAGFTCQDCRASFTSVSNLKRHRKKLHEERDAADPPSSSSSCPYPHCGHVAKDNYHLKVHTRKHTGRTVGPLSACTPISWKRILQNALSFQERGRSDVRFAHSDFTRSPI